MRRIDRSFRTADSNARYPLLQILRVRFRAFETKFGRLPKPDEPIFFNESLSDPVKASLSEARAQLALGAREAGVELAPVLSFLGLAPNETQGARKRAVDGSKREGRTHFAQGHPSRHDHSEGSSGWNRFLSDKRLHRRHRITRQELKTLSRTAFLGKTSTEREFLFVLEAIRKR